MCFPILYFLWQKDNGLHYSIFSEKDITSIIEQLPHLMVWQIKSILFKKLIGYFLICFHSTFAVALFLQLLFFFLRSNIFSAFFWCVALVVNVRKNAWEFEEQDGRPLLLRDGRTQEMTPPTLLTNWPGSYFWQLLQLGFSHTDNHYGRKNWKRRDIEEILFH